MSYNNPLYIISKISNGPSSQLLFIVLKASVGFIGFKSKSHLFIFKGYRKINYYDTFCKLLNGISRNITKASAGSFNALYK